MKKLTLLLLITTSFCFGQEKISSELGDFDEIKVFNGLDVILRKGDISRIEITGKKADEVVFKNTNNRLKLSMRFPETFNGDNVDIVVYYSNDLRLIDANEGSHVISKEVFKQQSIDLKTQEGAFINLEVDVKYLMVKAVTGGHVDLKGFATNQEVDANSGGSYKSYNLVSEEATVVSSSGAFVQVNASEKLSAKVTFGGTIYYKGNPTIVDTNKFAGGTIKSKD